MLIYSDTFSKVTIAPSWLQLLFDRKVERKKLPMNRAVNILQRAKKRENREKNSITLMKTFIGSANIE